MYTKIDELIWTDDKFNELSDDGKILFFYTLTNSHRNILGFYFLPVPYASFDLKWTPQRLDKGLRELLGKRLISYNFDTSIMFIKNYLKYNPLDNPNQVKGAVNALKKIPTNGIDQALKDIIETLDKPLYKPLIEQLEKRLCQSVTVPVPVNVTVTATEGAEVEAEEKTKTPYQQIVNLYHELCPSLPKVRSVSKEREKHIGARYNQYGLNVEIFKELFTKAENSEFLKGLVKNKDGKPPFKADFDWLMNEANMAKVLEDKYENKKDNPKETRVEDEFFGGCKLV